MGGLSFTPPTERFWSRVARDSLDGCWLWTGSTMGDGYGAFQVEGRQVPTHRYCYELVVGTIPQDLVLDHLCRTLACVNPAHLAPVTNKENILRGVGCTAQNARKTHCLRGHPLTGENVYFKRGGRECRICGREAKRRYEFRKRRDLEREKQDG